MRNLVPFALQLLSAPPPSQTSRFNQQQLLLLTAAANICPATESDEEWVNLCMWTMQSNFTLTYPMRLLGVTLLVHRVQVHRRISPANASLRTHAQRSWVAAVWGWKTSFEHAHSIISNSFCWENVATKYLRAATKAAAITAHATIMNVKYFN